MIWTILQTIGVLMSGFSIFTAFVLYYKQKKDLNQKTIREAIANTRSVINEQYSILQTEFIYFYLEEYITNKYIQAFITETARYVEKNLNLTLDEIKNYCTKMAKNSKFFEVPVLHTCSIYMNFKSNNQEITKSIIYDLSELSDILELLKLYQTISMDIYHEIEKQITNATNSIDVICDVLLENKSIINNHAIINQKILKKYFDIFQEQYCDQINSLKAICDINEYILKKLFESDSSALDKYIKRKRNGNTIPNADGLKDFLTYITNNIPSYIFTPDDYLYCGTIIGGINENID